MGMKVCYIYLKVWKHISAMLCSVTYCTLWELVYLYLYIKQKKCWIKEVDFNERLYMRSEIFHFYQLWLIQIVDTNQHNGINLEQPKHESRANQTSLSAINWLQSMFAHRFQGAQTFNKKCHSIVEALTCIYMDLRNASFLIIANCH